MESTSPGFMTPDDFGEAALERGNIQRPVAAHRQRLVYRERCVRRKLRVQPKLLLCEGKWERGVIPYAAPLPIVWRPENSPDASADTLPATASASLL